MAPSPEWVLSFPFIACPRPATLPRDALVTQSAKVPLSGLGHAPLNSPPEPEQVWAPLTRVTLPKYSLMNRRSFTARPLCVFLAAQPIRCARDTKTPCPWLPVFPTSAGVCCVCGSLDRKGHNAWVGVQQYLSQNCPRANVFVGIGHVQPRRSPVTGIVTPTIVLVGLALGCVLCLCVLRCLSFDWNFWTYGSFHCLEDVSGPQ